MKAVKNLIMLCKKPFNFHHILRRSINYNINNDDDIKVDPILLLIDSYRRSQILFTAVEFNLFDHLKQQPLSLEELANKLRLKYPSALQRFLNGCAALQLIEYDKTTKKYSNTRLSQKYLLSTSVMSINNYVNHNRKSSYFVWNHLSHAIRENAPQWSKAFKEIKKDLSTFDTHYRDDESEAIFISAMHGLGSTCFPQIVKSIDNLEKYRVFCDVGGATGCLAASICERNRTIQSIIYDLPRIEKYAKKYIDQTEIHMRQRIRFQSGDFFHDDLPQADLFGLGRILHDWNEEQCRKLLNKIYKRLPDENGAILIIEKLFNDDKETGPIDVITQDLNMLLVTLGRERTFSEYKQMLEEVGFKNIEVYRTGSDLNGIIAYK